MACQGGQHESSSVAEAMIFRSSVEPRAAAVAEYRPLYQDRNMVSTGH